MVFIETLNFTKFVYDYMSDDEYTKLQIFLAEYPDAGDLIIGTGGLRKLRWSIGNKGKRGGVRIIYYWHISKENIYLLTIYAKNEMSDLSSKEKNLLKKIVLELENEKA